jgi:hypothetical protein
MISGALVMSSPALAQNATEPTANGAVDNVTMTNEAVDMNLATEAAPVATAEPAAPAPEETAPAPTPARRSIPWGVLGLLGLIGLFGRRSRTD